MPRVEYSTSGNLKQGADPAQSELNGSGTCGEIAGIVIGNVLWPDSTTTPANKVKKTTNSEAQMDGIVGVSAGTYALDAAASYFQDGDVAAGVVAGQTGGAKMFARSNGLLDTYANIPAGEWTRSMGTCINATDVQMQIGATQQKP